jgi:thymidylate synthase (FAD)
MNMGVEVMPKKELDVKLISIPENMLDTIYTACRTCYSADGAVEIYSNITPDRDKKLSLIKRVISSGHYSTIEHIQVTFAINNISRAATHQLVRHRHMSFSQKSQRYVKEKGQFDYLTPDTIENNSELKQKFDDFMGKISEFYLELTDAGIPAEDARAVLPNAASTSMVASLNLRELIHLANLRLCTRAQKEIRILVKRMCEELIKEEPWLKDYLVPKCERWGFCDEDKSCGRMPVKGQ